VLLDGHSCNAGSAFNAAVGTITCTSAAVLSPQSGLVVVEYSANVSSSSVTFTYAANPTVTGVSPQTTIAAGGIPLTITGTGLALSSSTTIKFGAAAVLCTNSGLAGQTRTDTQLSCVTSALPLGAVQALTVVIDLAATTSSVTLQVVANPVAYSFDVVGTSLSTGPYSGGVPIAVVGANFTAVAGVAPDVSIDGVACAVSAVTATQILCTTGRGGAVSSSFAVVVTLGNWTASTGNTFTIAPDPTVTTFSPTVRARPAAPRPRPSGR
jgi:hypothetical protein